MTAPDRAELKKLADAATPGPWVSETDERDGYGVHERSKRFWLASCGTDNQCGRDADYIAAANPATVLALLAEIEQAERERDEMRAAVSCECPAGRGNDCPLTSAQCAQRATDRMADLAQLTADHYALAEAVKPGATVDATTWTLPMLVALAQAQRQDAEDMDAKDQQVARLTATVARVRDVITRLESDSDPVFPWWVTGLLDAALAEPETPEGR